MRRTRRQYVVTLDVDPISFDSDRESLALLLLRDRYNGRCFKGYFILQVERVSRLSRTRCNRLGDVDRGTVEVEFEALCSRYYPGDVVAGVAVLGCGGILTGAPDPKLGFPPVAVTLIEPNETIAEGQVVPVEIISADHGPMQPLVSAAARLLTCRLEAPVFRVVGKAPPPEKLAEVASDLLLEFAAALAARDALLAGPGARPRSFFALRLATFRGGDEDRALPPGFAPRPLLGRDDALEWARALAPGSLWTRPLERAYDWAGVCSVDPAAPLPPRYKVVDVTPEAAFALVLNAAANAVAALNDFVKVYHTEELIKAHVHLFRIMSRAQVDP